MPAIEANVRCNIAKAKWYGRDPYMSELAIWYLGRANGLLMNAEMRIFWKYHMATCDTVGKIRRLKTRIGPAE